MPRKQTTPRAPAHLSASAKKWYSEVVRDFELADHHLRLLQAACEAWDRMQGAREALAENGTTYTDRFGAPHARPEVGIERDSRTAFCRCVRELGLDLEPPEARPKRIGGQRW